MPILINISIYFNFRRFGNRSYTCRIKKSQGEQRSEIFWAGREQSRHPAAIHATHRVMTLSFLGGKGVPPDILLISFLFGKMTIWAFQQKSINDCCLQSRLNYPCAHNFRCVRYPSLPLSFCQEEFSRPISPTADEDTLRKFTVVSAWASANHN